MTSNEPFMTSLDKCNGSCNVVDDLSTKICVPSKTKDINFEVCFCDCKCKFNNKPCNPNQKWNTDECQCECRTCKKDYSWNPSTCICKYSKYLKALLMIQ